MSKVNKEHIEGKRPLKDDRGNISKPTKVEVDSKEIQKFKNTIEK